MASRKHLVAVNHTVDAAGLDAKGAHAAIVEFAQDLARRLDAVGIEKASMDLVKTYQSALKDLQRAAAVRAPAKPGRDAPEPEAVDGPDPASPPQLHAVEESPLAKLRREEAALAAKRNQKRSAAR